MKIPVIELMDYNVLTSMVDFFSNQLKDITILNKKINVVQSYSDKHNKYISPSMSIEILHRKNKSIGFNNFFYEEDNGNNILEFEGTLLEYSIQLNVYSNTRGEIHRWCSILDGILKNGEDGIPLNTYYDNGNIKEIAVGSLDYDYSTNIKNINLEPNVISYDFHSIFEIKLTAIQKYKVVYDILDIVNITGKLK
jgi:hypothetical protein